jgi:hypothetical protein
MEESLIQNEVGCGKSGLKNKPEIKILNGLNRTKTKLIEGNAK